MTARTLLPAFYSSELWVSNLIAGKPAVGREPVGVTRRPRPGCGAGRCLRDGDRPLRAWIRLRPAASPVVEPLAGCRFHSSAVYQHVPEELEGLRREVNGCRDPRLSRHPLTSHRRLSDCYVAAADRHAPRDHHRVACENAATCRHRRCADRQSLGVRGRRSPCGAWTCVDRCSGQRLATCHRQSRVAGLVRRGHGQRVLE